MKRVVLAILFWMFSASVALALTGPDKLFDPKLEARAVALQQNLRCVVCQGQSLDESDAPLAGDLRRLIRARIAAGDSDRQVDDFLVARYGDFILMKPPLKPMTYLLWFGPILVIGIGAGILFMVLRRARKNLSASDLA